MQYIDMPRSKVSDVLDDVRKMLHEKKSPEEIETYLKKKYDIEPLESCSHDSAFVDNCMRCAPRWMIIGPKIRAR